MDELWKQVVGYEGVYEVSNLGRIKSLAREWKWGNGAIRKRGDLIMSPGINSSGYPTVNLIVDGKVSNKVLHRLVAKAFIQNPLQKPEVNHKNGIKTDATLNNLEWCTREENQQHAYATDLHVRTKEICREGCKKRFSKPVLQMSAQGELIKEWLSEADAARALGIFQANINKCVHDIARTAGGFIWRRA